MLTPLQQGWCSDVKMQSGEQAHLRVRGFYVAALPQSNSAPACSSPAPLGPRLQESCWVSMANHMSCRTAGMAASSTGHYHPNGFLPPGPCSACSQAVKLPSSEMKETADEKALPEHGPPRALSCPPRLSPAPPSWASDPLLWASRYGPCGWVTPKAAMPGAENRLLAQTDTG